ncbi:MAG: RICIN domain-containing protein [bacterium]
MSSLAAVCMLLALVPSPLFAATNVPSIDPQATYRKPVIYATWIMIWIGATEKWWRPQDYEGCRVKYPEGLSAKESIDWNDPVLRKFYLEQIRDAGIDVIVIDFTNGFRWEKAARDVQKFCYENNMKMCIAFNPQGGSSMESACGMVWKTFADPGVHYSEAYFQKDGKPLCVIYTWRSGYAASVAQSGPERGRFSTVWASGEDGADNKWGWQLEPWELAHPSADSVFVNSAVKWNSPRGTAETWRKSLAVFDYNMLIARRSRPKHVIIGSYDDMHERNSWIKIDTAGADRGAQMRDIQGKVSADTYYDRVKSWIRGNAPVFVKGGIIKDGAYRMVNVSTGLGFSSVTPTAHNSEDLGAPLLQRAADHRYLGATECYYWFYHLGDNEFRIVHLSSALSLADESGTIKQVWDDVLPNQSWKIEGAGGNYLLVNKATGKALGVRSDKPGTEIVTRVKNRDDTLQQWALNPVAILE